MPTAATANRPRIRGEVQPHSLPSLSASSSATSQTASSTAGSSGSRAGVRIGDSGMSSSAAMRGQRGDDHRQPEQARVAEHVDDRSGDHDAEAEADGGQRGEHAQRAGHLARRTRRGRCRTTAAARRRRRPAPPGRRSASRCSGASAAISEPIASANRVITSIRVLPTTSPIRPSSGRGDARGEQVRRQHPGHRRLVGVELALDGRQHRHDQRLQQRERRHRDREHGEGESPSAAERRAHRTPLFCWRVVGIGCRSQLVSECIRRARRRPTSQSTSRVSSAFLVSLWLVS